MKITQTSLLKIFQFFVFFGIVFLGCKFDTIPTWKEIKPQYLNAKALNEKLKNTKSDILHAEDIQSQFLSTQKEYQEMTGNIPTEKNFPAFIETLLLQLKSTGLSLNTPETIQPFASASQGFYKIIPVELSLTGTYGQFLAFLKLLDDKQYLIKIDKWSLTRTMPPITTVLTPDTTSDNLAIVLTLQMVVLS